MRKRERLYLKKFGSTGVLSRGVLLMTVSNLIVKAAGLLFKVPLTSLIGEEGMGYFNTAYTLFTWLYMLSCAGLPTAASMIISRLPDKKRRSGAKRVFFTALMLFTLIGIVGCIILLAFSGPLSRLMRVEGAGIAIAVIAPTLFFICQSAALRGYFQGLGDLRPHSLSQTAEALGKAALGVTFAHYAVNSGKSVPEAAAYAAAGIVIGVAAGTVILYTSYFFSKKAHGDPCALPVGQTAKQLLKLSLPITLSSSVMSLSGIIDSLIMTRSLHSAGMSQAQTAAVWGNYSSLAVPMFNLPSVLTLPIAYALLPALTSALSSGDGEKARKLTRGAFETTAVISVPCAVGLSALSGPLLSLMFEDSVASRGAMMLTLLAPASMLLCVVGLTNTVLQASGHERIPLFAMLCGAAVKLASTRLLTPHLMQYATPVSTVLCYFAAALISFGAIARDPVLRAAVNPTAFVLPITVSAAAISAAAFICPVIGIIGAGLIAAAVYFSLIFIAGYRKNKT